MTTWASPAPSRQRAAQTCTAADRGSSGPRGRRSSRARRCRSSASSFPRTQPSTSAKMCPAQGRSRSQRLGQGGAARAGGGGHRRDGRHCSPPPQLQACRQGGRPPAQWCSSRAAAMLEAVAPWWRLSGSPQRRCDLVGCKHVLVRARPVAAARPRWPPASARPACSPCGRLPTARLLVRRCSSQQRGRDGAGRLRVLRRSGLVVSQQSVHL